MHQYGFAIVGTGVISAIHADAIGKIENARLVAACDVDAERARRFARQYGIRGYGDLAELLADPAVEIVCICTPSGLREGIAVQAAEAGKHIICEKPVEIDLARIDRMIAACEANGVTMTGIFNYRFNRAYRKIKETIAEGKLGRLVLGDVYVKWYRSDEYYGTAGWRGTWRLDGGGALMNQSIHFVDLIQWLMGPVAEVKAFAATRLHPIEVEDTVTACLKFESGALGVIEGTTAAYPGLSDRIELHGSKGCILVENGNIKRWEVEDCPLSGDELAGLNRMAIGTSREPMAMDSDMHRQQIEATLRSIASGLPVELDGREARKAVELIQRIYRSAGILQHNNP